MLAHVSAASCARMPHFSQLRCCDRGPPGAPYRLRLNRRASSGGLCSSFFLLPHPFIERQGSQTATQWP